MAGQVVKHHTFKLGYLCISCVIGHIQFDNERCRLRSFMILKDIVCQSGIIVNELFPVEPAKRSRYNINFINE